MEFPQLFKRLIIKIQSQIAKSQVKSQIIDIYQGAPKSGLSKEAVWEKMKRVPFWWHCLELGYGIVTPGHEGGLRSPSGTQNLLKQFQLPDNLKGKSVLDIGAWDGFFSFALEKRGAFPVLAIDNFYRDQLEQTGSQGFEVAKEILASQVEFKKASVYDLNPEQFGMFDIVLFPGVFYHLKHPLLALEKVYSVCKETLILETHFDPYRKEPPLAVFYEKAEINNDPTTFWGFNESGLKAVLRFVGFKNPQTLYKYADRIIIKAQK